MRTVALICILPALAYADCGCRDVEKAIAKERQADTKYHGCRNCKAVKSVDISACPDSGYECNVDWAITSNMLFSDTCHCAEARCAGTARLAFEKTIVNKMRCNNSQWIVGDESAKPVVCAKSCDTGVCKASHPRASADFKPLSVKAADADNRCARGVCEPDYGIVALNADGSLRMRLPGVSEVICASDGIWSSVGPYLMCNTAPYCGPGRCPSFVEGSAMTSGEVIPLTVKDNGEQQCATASCQYGFVSMKSDGSIFLPVPDGTFSLLTCLADQGTWRSETGQTFLFIMCKLKPEPGIPATTTTTTAAPMKPCAPYGPAPPADCAVAGGCGTAPIITATKISCAGGKNVMIIHMERPCGDARLSASLCFHDSSVRTAAGQPELKKIAAWAECRDGIWYNSDSPNKLDNNPNAPFRPPVTIGCSQ